MCACVWCNREQEEKEKKEMSHRRWIEIPELKRPSHGGARAKKEEDEEGGLHLQVGAPRGEFIFLFNDDGGHHQALVYDLGFKCVMVIGFT